MWSEETMGRQVLLIGDCHVSRSCLAIEVVAGGKNGKRKRRRDDEGTVDDVCASVMSGNQPTPPVN